MEKKLQFCSKNHKGYTGKHPWLKLFCLRCYYDIFVVSLFSSFATQTEEQEKEEQTAEDKLAELQKTYLKLYLICLQVLFFIIYLLLYFGFSNGYLHIIW